MPPTSVLPPQRIKSDGADEPAIVVESIVGQLVASLQGRNPSGDQYPLFYLNLRDFGARGDLVYLADGSITLGQAVLTSPSGLFKATDVGKIVQIAGAGAQVTPTGTVTNGSTTVSALSSIAGVVPGTAITGAGIPANTTVVAILSANSVQISAAGTATNAGTALVISGALSGTITGFTSATTVTISANAATTVAAGGFGYGTDDSVAVANAVSALNTSPGTGLYVGPGNYYCAGGYVINQGCHIFGNGASTAGFGSVFTLKPGANSTMFTISTKFGAITDLGLDGNYTTQTGASNGIAISLAAAFGKLDKLWVGSFNGDGIVFTGAGSTGWHTSNVEMRLNQGYGININASAFDNDFYSINIGTSGKSGVRCVAADNTFEMLHSWGNGTIGTANDQNGLLLPSGVSSCRFINCYFETNLGAGARMPNGGCRGHIFTGCQFWKNVAQGCYAFTASNITFIGCSAFDNGQSGAAGINGCGFANDTGSFWTVNGCNFYDDQGSKTQTFAYFEAGAANNNTLVGNNMAAAQHKTGSTTIVGAANVPVAASMGTLNQV